MNRPIHGERTQNGIWCDNRSISNWDDALNATRTPDCDDMMCSYSFVENANSPNPVELTYNAEYGLWLCPTHWFDVEAETQPEIVKIDNGHYQVRKGGDIISNHSSRWGAEQVASKLTRATYEPPRLTFTAPIPAAAI